ncbi:hypothetical protein BDV93DRAFT_577418 [Ceratobasidium sp. AG-I]|nr:hypothetical protein BDV93DRAFT_577418 [Ceratobasidium sp. AG-I]
MSTLHSDQVAEYFRTVHGFTYINDENLPIVLPTDQLAERLNIVLHTMIRLAYEGTNAPSVVDELLRSGGVDKDARGAKVLDFVTNSGAWVQEMAAVYPTANFVSLDLKPLTAFVPHPRIDFEVYNFSTGFYCADASFDVVHAANCVTLTKDFNFLLREMYRVLKPASDPSVHLHSAPRRAAGVKMFRQAWEDQGIDLNPWEDMSSRLDPCHPLWNNHLAGQRFKFEDGQSSCSAVQGFHSINMQTRLIPSGPWLNDETQHIIGGLARLMHTHVWKMLFPLLLMRGMEPAEAQSIVDGSIEELLDDRFKSYMKCKIWTARRI